MCAFDSGVDRRRFLDDQRDPGPSCLRDHAGRLSARRYQEELRQVVSVQRSHADHLVDGIMPADFHCLVPQCAVRGNQACGVSALGPVLDLIVQIDKAS